MTDLRRDYLITVAYANATSAQAWPRVVHVAEPVLLPPRP
jgi:hypothetical protein